MDKALWGIWDGVSICPDPEDGECLWEMKEAAEKELENEREWYGDNCIVVRVTVTLEE